MRPSASSTPCSFSLSTAAARTFVFFVSFAMISALHHFEAHRAGGAFDDLRRRVDVVRVEVGHLGLRDFGELRALDRSGDDLAGFLRTGLEVHGLLDEVGGRRLLRGERKAAVRIDGDDGRQRRGLFHLFRLRVERLAEFHDVHAALTQSRADRGRGIGGSSGHLELDIARNLLGHCHSLYCWKDENAAFRFKFSGLDGSPKRSSRDTSGPKPENPYFDSSTCSKSSSTGVARPKIDTDTLTRFFSKSSSSTVPLKLAKGPSSTLTLSPIS